MYLIRVLFCQEISVVLTTFCCFYDVILGFRSLLSATNIQFSDQMLHRINLSQVEAYLYIPLA